MSTLLSNAPVHHRIWGATLILTAFILNGCSGIAAPADDEFFGEIPLDPPSEDEPGASGDQDGAGEEERGGSTPSSCGDGQLNPDEECDDGNRSDFDGCSSRCEDEDIDEPSVCGDGIVDGDEECDDGNRSDFDGCASNCELEPETTCGDGVVEGREECDDGNVVGDDGCSASCRIVRCGNARVDDGEECDDGNDDDTDGCPNDCGVSVCGNARVESTEECDDGNSNDLDACTSECLLVVCGDGRIDGAEECDPGPDVAGDDCSDRCTVLPPNCGDQVVQSNEGEQCDDGNEVAGDGCHYCVFECGDGFVDRENGEQCEPGTTAGRFCLTTNLDTCVRCSPAEENCGLRDPCDPFSCELLPQCGDGILQTDAGEQCETPDGVTCDAACLLMTAECGNDILQPGELCDDTTDPFCVDCVPVTPPNCGDGIVQDGEECDSLDRAVCNEFCDVVTCEAEGLSVELDNGAFDSSVIPWSAEFPVVASHLAADGSTAAGALQVSFDAPPASLAQVSGASVCIEVMPDTIYEATAQYKMPAEQVGFRATVSLFVHRAIDCTDVPATPESTPLRGRELGQWSAISHLVDTGLADESDGQPVYLRIRLDALRLPEAESGVVYWDDVTLAPNEATAAATAISGCGDCVVDASETCDDGNQVDGDGCSSACLLEECTDGTETFCSDCETCRFNSCAFEVDACFEMIGLAEDGPGVGLERGFLCGELHRCVEQTGCAGETAIQASNLLFSEPALENCYCGTAGEECIDGEANGSCQLQVEAALETTDPVEIFQRFSGTESNYPAFTLVSDLRTCEATFDCGCEAEPSCGDGVLQERSASFLDDFVFCDNADPAFTGCFFEQCDGASVPEGQVCDSNCFLVECGNGIPQEDEECDDGNLVDGDGCSATCTAEFECGDGELHPIFEPCDTGLTAATPLCLQSEIDDGSVTADSCGCTVVQDTPASAPRCEVAVCGNGIIQPEAGEECDPPIDGACSTDCQLELDLCTQCLLEFDFRDTPGLQSCFGAASFSNIEVGGFAAHNCSGDECFPMWSCIQTSGSMTNRPFTAFYCGFDVELNDCLAPDFIAEGPCVAPIDAAFEAQLGSPPENPREVIENINTGDLGAGRPANNARAVAESCLVAPALQADLEAAEAAGRLGTFTVDECFNACIVD